MTDNRPVQGESSAKRRRRFWRGGLSIQSKLLIMLLAVSLVSSVIVGAIGFFNGRQSLHDAAVDQLTTIRSMRAVEVQTAIDAMKLDASMHSRNLSAQNMSSAINSGFDELRDMEISPEESSRLESYYGDVFLPALSEQTGQEYGDAALVPQSRAGQYLQLQYTTQNQDLGDDYDEQLSRNDSGDGTAYSAAAGQYGDYFGRLVEEGGYEDALLLNLDGDVTYTAYKGVELGTNLLNGAYRESALAEAYSETIATNSVTTVTLTDVENWIPSLDQPTMWVLSPVGNDEAITGVMAFQVSIDAINEVTTGGETWKEQGLGDSGEVYLVGRDDLMRSTSRKYVEDPQGYEQLLVDGGSSPDVASSVTDAGTPVLVQPVETSAVDAAQAGSSGTTTGTDYLGGDSVTAYAPLEVEGLDWVIIARIDSDEAFAPVTVFTRNVMLSLLGILVGVSLLSLLLAQVFTRPVHRLVGAVHRVAEGDLEARAPQDSRDEFGDLGAAFNDMASSLQVKQDLIDEQQVENEKLLHTLMPESVAAKYKQGDETITEAHENVSVVYAELTGFDAFARGLSAEEEIALLNTLMRGFDEAAEKAGVEKVRTLRGGYLASSGLVVPRVDNMRRAVDFATGLLGVIERFNAQNKSSLGVRVGVDTGTVTSGLVARTSLAYDLWGEAVNLAYRVRSVTGEPGIYVSQTVRDRTHETVDYVEAGTIQAHERTETVWKVV